MLPRIKSLRKQGTEDDLINTQYNLHYELLFMSVRRGWGGERGLGGIPVERMFVEMARDGVLTHRQLCVLSVLKFACAFVQANQSFLFTF